MRILKNIDGIGHIELDEEDVVRHKLVKAIIKAYDKERKKKCNNKIIVSDGKQVSDCLLFLLFEVKCNNLI